MDDLTLIDLTGAVVERRGLEKPRWREGVPVHAFFEQKNEIAGGGPSITVLPAKGRMFEETRRHCLRLLREQFPSMTPIPAHFHEHSGTFPDRFRISASDFAAMRLIFGGREWS